MIEGTVAQGTLSRRGRCSVGLPFEAWPEGDRILWSKMYPEDIDDRNTLFRGKAPKEKSIDNVRQLLCRVAGFHAREMPSLLDRPFIDRFGTEQLILLVDDFADTCSNETIRDYLNELARYLKRSGGVADVWFDRILRNLARNTPSELRRSFPLSTSEIATRAATHMTKALADLETDAERTRAFNAPERFRNGYILLLLTKRPLRLTNLSQLVLAETFFAHPDFAQPRIFEISFPGSMMKNRDSYSSTFDAEEGEFFDWTRRYIDRVLPRFPDGDGLFRSRQGGRLTPIGLYQIIIAVTKDILGIRLCPHDFRRIFTDSAITSGKSLSDINHASQRRPESERIYDYKTAVSTRARRVVRPMLDAHLSALLSRRTPPRSP